MAASKLVRGVFGSVVLLVASASSAEIAHAEILETLRPCFADLVGRAERLPDDVELAAFLVQHGDGTRSCTPWPMNFAQRRAEYRGVFPDGTFALVHTHPKSWEEPSRGDALQASRIGMPIYVASRSAVWVVEPTQEKSAVVRDARWRVAGRTSAKPDAE